MLDIGCGRGDLISYLKKKKISIRYTGLDINDKFIDIWLDLRVLLFSKFLDNYNTINENLTFYRQFEGNISSKFKKFKKSWWKRRNDAHDYFFYFMKINNLNTKKNLDFYVTKFINKFIK